jgi:DNA-binding SARP family transcriptional activator
MRFSILGPFEVTSGGIVLTPTAPKLRQLLAQLVLQCNQIAHIDKLIEELWDDDPPATARTTLQTYVYQLRKQLAKAGRGDERLVLTKTCGYVAAVEPDTVDAYVFDRYVSRGQAALQRGEAHVASRELSQALALWRGKVLADVVTGSVLSAQAIRLEENCLRALEMRVKADLTLGRHREVVSELKGLVAAHPLHEGLYSQLMLALYRSGRRFEAMDVYQQLRRSLVDDLGLEPSTELIRLHQAILAGDPALDPSVPAGAITVDGRGSDAVPAQLPAEPAEFIGRADELERIRAVFDVPGGPRTVTIEGAAGVGKTALAVRAAYGLRFRFPDGQFFVPLGGSGEPVEVREALGRMLLAVGTPAAQLPSDLGGRSAMFREWSAQRRVLVVVDDATTAAQFTALLPAGDESGAIVTGRSPLSELSGSPAVQLGALRGGEAVDLLASVVAPARVMADPAAAYAIVARCGHLPLAIRATGARLNAVPHVPIGRFAARLADVERGRDEPPPPDREFVEALDQAYRRLDAAAQRALRLLSLMPRDRGATPTPEPDRDDADSLRLVVPDNSAA